VTPAPDPLFALDGRVAIVTGGMGQLGSRVAVGLAERGMRVAVVDCASEPKTAGSDMADGLRRGVIRWFDADVTRRASVETAAAAIETLWEVPHLLVNAAGIDSPPDAPAAEVGPFETYPEEAFDHVMAVNVKGTLLCCQVFGSAMARLGRGSIVNVSSIYGLLSPVQSLYEFRRADGAEFTKPVAYSVSKSAILNLTRYLATLWASEGVRVNTVTFAGIANEQPTAFVEAYAERMPVRRMMNVAEALGPIVFLAADASSYVTGANVVVDGGWTAW
jgi:NAD(P)-dependent dehydrogenase (short-subunit alcohol dehydrogenase family)